MTDPAQLLNSLFQAAVAAAGPSHCLAAHMPDPPGGRIFVAAAGKAAAGMARAFEDAAREQWPADAYGRITGLAVTVPGAESPCERIEVVTASHPVPDAAGERAARKILEAAQALGADDLLVFLVSGGGSALIAAPAGGVTLEDKQAVTASLLASGAGIREINAVRKHVSAIKGGRLAEAAWPARTVTLAISDVAGDDPSIIASGPTVPDPSTRHDAMRILARYRINAPERLRAWLDDPACETPAPDAPCFAGVDYRLVATPAMALAAAGEAARAAGLNVHVMGDALEGDVQVLARDHARLAMAIAAGKGPFSPPAVILSGGEATVSLAGMAPGATGGPNTEFALALALLLEGAAGIHALVADSDGIDGSGGHAGAIIAPDTLARAHTAGLDPAASLAAHDSAGLFSHLGDILRPGPTGTNVNDFRAILITP